MSRTVQIVLREIDEVERRIGRLRSELDTIENAFLRDRRAENINHPEAHMAVTRARVQEIREDITRAAHMAATQARMRKIREEVTRAEYERDALIIESMDLMA